MAQTIKEIIEACAIGGVGLHQRLAVVEYSTIPALQHEVKLLRLNWIAGRCCGLPWNEDMGIEMEFSFGVRLVYSSAQAFIEESAEAAHDRLAKRIFEVLADEFPPRDGVTVEVEPA